MTDLPALIRGAIELERTERGLLPHRLPAWARAQTDDPQLLEHLAAENAWTEQQTAHLADLRARVYDELSRILPEDDESAPWRQGSWVYRVRRRAGPV